MSSDKGFELIGAREITVYVDGRLYLIPPTGRYIANENGFGGQIHIMPFEIQRFQALEDK